MTEKSSKTKLIVVLLGLVIVGGIVSFLLNSQSSSEEEQQEEFQFVEFTPPPPPPPPPVPDEPEKLPDEFDEPIETIDIPEEVDTTTTEAPNDLGIDLGDLAAGDGPGGFVMNIGKFAKRGKFSDEEDDELGAGEGVEAPSPTLKTQPIYPSAMLKQGIGGKVLILAVVSAAGQVVKATIKGSSGHGELDSSAMQAVLKWKFKPGKKNGKEVQATCIIPYTFEVKKN